MELKTKKGSIADIFIFMVMGFICIVFFGLWIYAHHLITTSLASIPSTSGMFNISDASARTFGQIDSQMHWLNIIAVAIIFGMIITMFVSNFYVGAHPVLFIPYLFVEITGIVASAFISNAYEGLLSNAAFGQTLQENTAGTFIMLHLPIWTAIICTIGTILLLIGITKDREMGGGLR